VQSRFFRHRTVSNYSIQFQIKAAAAWRIKEKEYAAVSLYPGRRLESSQDNLSIIK
jgi:hypothetical protein